MRRLQQELVGAPLFLLVGVGVIGERRQTVKRRDIATVGGVVIGRAGVDDQRFTGGIVQPHGVCGREFGATQIKQEPDDARVALNRFLAGRGRRVEVYFVERHPGDLGRTGWIAVRGGEAVAIVDLSLPGRKNRGRHFSGTDQADERAARELRGGAIMEPSTMSLQRLALWLLADLRSIYGRPRALLLR